jgi:hypothetical protein
MRDRAGARAHNVHTTPSRPAPEMCLNWGRTDLWITEPSNRVRYVWRCSTRYTHGFLCHRLQLVAVQSIILLQDFLLALTPATKPATAEAAELCGYAKQTGLCHCGCTVDRLSLLRPYLEQLDGASGLFEGLGTIDMQNELAASALSQTRVSLLLPCLTLPSRPRLLPLTYLSLLHPQS